MNDNGVIELLFLKCFQFIDYYNIPIYFWIKHTNDQIKYIIIKIEFDKVIYIIFTWKCVKKTHKRCFFKLRKRFEIGTYIKSRKSRRNVSCSFELKRARWKSKVPSKEKPRWEIRFHGQNHISSFQCKLFYLLQMILGE